MRATARRLLGEVALGASLGLLVLGLGGRLVMRVIALRTGQPPALSAGGTLTVLGAGAGAGAAGAVLHALARAAAGRVARGRTWVRLTLFAALLALVTARGLRGSPPGPAMLFYPLVLVYGVGFVAILARRTNRARPSGGGSAECPAAAVQRDAAPDGQMPGAPSSVEIRGGRPPAGWNRPSTSAGALLDRARRRRTPRE